MSPLNTGEVAVHEPTALLVNVFEEGLADEIVVVQSHKQTIRGTSRTAADVGGILPDAGMPMGEPVFFGDIPPVMSQHATVAVRRLRTS